MFRQVALLNFADNEASLAPAGAFLGPLLTGFAAFQCGRQFSVARRCSAKPEDLCQSTVSSRAMRSLTEHMVRV